MSNEEPKKHEKLGLITAIIGSLAIILVAVISAHSIFPQVLFYSIVIVFSAVILGLLIYQFIYPPVLRIIRNVRFRRKQNILVLQYSNTFRDLVKEFYENARSDKIRSLKELINSIIELQRGKDWRIYCAETIDLNDTTAKGYQTRINILVSSLELWKNTAH